MSAPEVYPAISYENEDYTVKYFSWWRVAAIIVTVGAAATFLAVATMKGWLG